jgi:hypothetical protein
MKKYRMSHLLTILSVILMLTSFTTANQRTVSGKVVGSANNGLSNAYIYVIAGEEETLSIKDGQFTLKTWQPLPVTLVVEHADFEKQRIIIRKAGQQVVVRLVEKRHN